MSLRQTYFILFLFLSSILFYGQTDTIKKHKAIKFYSISANLGPQSNINDMSFKEFKNSGIQHQFLEKDYTGFKSIAPDPQYKQKYEPYFLLNSNFVFYNKRKAKYNTKNELNARLCITQQVSNYYEFEKETISSFDTLHAQNSLQLYFVNKETNENYELTYKSNTILFEFGFKHYITDQLKKWNIFTGIGIGIGKSFNNQLTTTHTYRETFTNQYGYVYYDEYDSFKTSKVEDAYNIKVSSGNVQKAVASIGLQCRLRLEKSKRMDVTALAIEAFGGLLNTQQANNRYYQNYFYGITASIKLYFHREKY